MKTTNLQLILISALLLILILPLILAPVQIGNIPPSPDSVLTVGANANYLWLKMDDGEPEYIAFSNQAVKRGIIETTYGNNYIMQILPIAITNFSNNIWLCPIYKATIDDYGLTANSEWAEIWYNGTITGISCFRYNDWFSSPPQNIEINKISINTTKRDKSSIKVNITLPFAVDDTGFGFLIKSSDLDTLRYAKVKLNNGTILWVALNETQNIPDVNQIIGFYNSSKKDLLMKWNWNDMFLQYPNSTVHFEVINMGSGNYGLLTGLYGFGNSSNIYVDPILVSEDEAGDGSAYSNQRKIVRNSTNAIHIIYHNALKFTEHRSSLNNGTTWSSATTIGVDECQYSALAINSTNALYVVCGGGGASTDGLYSSVNNGGTWTEINTQNFNYAPSLLVDSSNNLHVVSHNETGTDNVYYRRSVDNGANWENTITLTGADSSNFDYYASIVENSTGYIFAFWVSYESGIGPDEDIFYRYCNNKNTNCSYIGNWSTETNIIDTSGQIGVGVGHYSVVINNTINSVSGTHIIYSEKPLLSSDNEIYSAYILGTTASTPLLISNDVSFLDINPTITTNGTNLFIEWIKQTTQSKIMYANSSDGGVTWSTVNNYTNQTFADNWVTSIYNSSSSKTGGVLTDFIWIQDDLSLGLDVFYGNFSVPPPPPPPSNPPVVSFGTNPINYLNNSNQTIRFQFSCTDDVGLGEIQLWGNWTGTWHMNYTTAPSGIINGTTYSKTVSTLPEGKGHIWGVWCNDTHNQGDWENTNRSFAVDLTSPVVTLPYYTNGTKKTNLQTLILNISVTDATTTPSDCILNINGTNQTITYSGGWCNTSNGWTSNLANGNKTILIWVNDSAKNTGINNSYVVDIIPSNTAPYSIQINDIDGNVNNTITNDNTPEINFTVIDAQETTLNCNLYVNGIFGYGNNASVLNNTATIISINQTISDGTNRTYVNCSDGSLTNSSSIWWFIVDTTSPTITLPYYTNGTKKTNTQQLTLNISVTDTGGLTGGICLIDVNGTNQSVTLTSGWCNSSSINLTNLGDGNKTIKVWANDSVNNWGLNNSYVVDIDSTNPIAEFGTNPINAYNSSTGTLTFDSKCTDNNIKTLQIWGNWTGSWVVNQTNSSPINNSYWNISIGTIADGYYVWGVYCNDTFGNFDWSDTNRTLLIDTTYPQIQFISPTQSNNTYNSTNWIYANVSITETNEDTIIFNLYFSNGTLINSTQSKTLQRTINWTNLADGTYLYNVSINDTSGNTNQTETRRIILDTTYPQITIVYPTNTTYSVNVSQLNYTYIETNPDKCWYSTNRGITNSSTQICGTNFTGITSIEGLNNWTIYLNDTSGNTNSSIVYFFKDTSFPQIEFVSLTKLNNSYVNNSWVYMNVSIIEINRNYTTFSLYNGSGIVNSTKYTILINETNITNLADGKYEYNATVNDSAGNTNQTETRWIILDTINPLIQFVDNTTANGSYMKTFIETNITFSDVNLDTAILRLYNSTGLVQENITTTSFLFVNFTGLSDGTYYLNATVNDSAGNTNKTETRNITLDTTNPTITIINPELNVDENANPVNYLITTNEISSCDISIDNALNTSMFSPNNLSHNLSRTMSNGIHTFIVYCNDSVLNFNSANRSFNFYLIGAYGTGGGAGGGGDSGIIKENITDLIEPFKLEIEIKDKWYFLEDNLIYIITRNLTNNLIDVDNITFEIKDEGNNFLEIENSTKRLSIGEYKSSFYIEKLDLKELSVKVIARKGIKKVESEIKIPIQSKPIERISEVKKIISDNLLLSIIVGISFLIFIFAIILFDKLRKNNNSAKRY